MDSSCQRIRLSLAFAAFLAFTLQSTQGAPGDLDFSFNPPGKIVTPIGTGDDFGKGVAVQSDGKIVVVGISSNGSNSDFAVARYNTNGALDSTFGTGGKVTTPIGSGNDEAYGVALQADGKIVVAGNSSNGSNFDFAVVRYNANGTLDTSFNSTGKVTTAIGSGNDEGQAVAIQSDGKIVVTGYTRGGSSGDNFGIVRYNTNGTLDTNFNGNGIQTIDFFGTQPDYPRSVAIQSDGKIVVAGTSFNGSNWVFALARCTSTGAPDSTFGNGGKVTTAIGSVDDEAYSVAVQPDGKIVAAGYYKDAAHNETFALVRYTSTGALDTTFNASGKVTQGLSLGSEEVATSVAIQGDGKIVAGGYALNFQTYYMAIVRLTATGDLDSTFNGGKAFPLVGGSAKANAVALQSDGAIVAAGYVYNGINNDFALGRLTSGGVSDVSLNAQAGRATTFVSSYYIGPSDVLVQPNNQIVLIGTARNSPATTNDDFGLVRYNADGTLDSSFGSAGRVSTNIGSGQIDNGYSVCRQSDGKILAAGYAQGSSDADFALVRYNNDGSLDSGFGSGGKVTTNYLHESASAVAVQADGKIVAAGSTGNPGDVMLMRYLSTGAVDSSYGSSGRVVTALTSTDKDGASALAFQPDGKLLVAGYVYSGSQRDSATVRYNTDGTLDSTFGTGGKVITVLSSQDDYANGIAVQSDGKVVIVGFARLNSLDQIYIMRLNSDGSPDAAFGASGKVTFTLGSGVQCSNRFVLQPDGKIVVAGYNYDNAGFVLARFTSGGVLDTSFGTGGSVTTPGTGKAGSVALSLDGKIVVAGGPSINADVYFGAARYEAASAPTATTGAISGMSYTGSTVALPAGTANANMAQTTIYFEYGTTTAYGTTVLSTTIPAGPDVTVYFPAISGLTPETTYHYRLKALNRVGTTYGGDMTFTTLGATLGVEQPAATSLTQNGVRSFGTTAVGSPVTFTFTVKNSGVTNLTGLGITKDGINAADFLVTASPVPPVAPGGSTTFTVQFNPATAGQNGAAIQKAAAIHIASNDGTKNPFHIGLVGTALSYTADADGDGMNDASEWKMAALGFDWQTAQPALVTTYYSNASGAGLYDQTQYAANRTAGQNDVINAPNTYSLYTLSQVQALNVGVPLLTKDGTGSFKLTLALQKSILPATGNFVAFAFPAPTTTINAQGQLEVLFTVPDNAAFFRVQAK